MKIIIVKLIYPLLKLGKLTNLKNIVILKICPPVAAYDIELNQLKRTHYGLNVSIDLSEFMLANKLKWSDLFLGLSAVLDTTQGQHFFAMQHSGQQADFHNKRDWLHTF